MKDWLKGGIIGFVLVLIGLWVFLIILGRSDGGWECATIETFSGSIGCGFSEFIFSPIHWGFVIFFSLVGFAGGVIDVKIINKLILEIQDPFRKLLKITTVILLTAIIVFGAIGILAFGNWVKTLVYTVILAVLILVISLIVEKVKYSDDQQFSTSQPMQQTQAAFQ